MRKLLLAIILAIIPSAVFAAANPANVLAVPSMAVLSSYPAIVMQQYGTFQLNGYYAGSTAGGGTFTWLTAAQASGLTPDGGVVIAPSDHPGVCSFGCLKRQTTIFRPQFYGAFMDGSHHPVSSLYSTLATFQAAYPWEKSFHPSQTYTDVENDEIDGIAIQACLFAANPVYSFNGSPTPLPYYAHGGTCDVPASFGYVNETIYVPFNVRLTSDGYLYSGSGLAVQNPCEALKSAIGVATLCWTGNKAGIEIDTLNFYRYLNSGKATNPSNTGTAISATAETPSAFATITIPCPGGAAHDYAGSVISLTGGTGSTGAVPRLVLDNTYSGGDCVLSVENDWISGSVPDNTTTYTIPEVNAGQQFTATEGVDGASHFDTGSNPVFTLSSAPNIEIDHLTLVTDGASGAGGGMAAIRMDGANESSIHDLASAGFNNCWYLNASFYIKRDNTHCSALHAGLVITQDTWWVGTNNTEFATRNSDTDPTDIYRPSAQDREWWTSNIAARDIDWNPYLFSGGICYGSSYSDGDGGDWGEAGDRAFSNYCGQKVKLTGYSEQVGQLTRQVGSCGYFDNGGQLDLNLSGWETIPPDGTVSIPMICGITPFIKVDVMKQQFAGNKSQYVAQIGNLCSDTCLDFHYGGFVHVGANVIPGDGDVANFTATASGTTLTVSAVANGYLHIGEAIIGAGIPDGTTITALGTGTGNTGTYTLSASSSVGSGESMTAYGTWPRANNPNFQWDYWTNTSLGTISFTNGFSSNPTNPLLVSDNNGHVTYSGEAEITSGSDIAAGTQIGSIPASAETTNGKVFNIPCNNSLSAQCVISINGTGIYAQSTIPSGAPTYLGFDSVGYSSSSGR